MNLYCARLEIKWWLLLLFIPLFLNSVYGSSVQNSLTTSKNLITSKILFWNIIKWTSIKYVCPNFWSFIRLRTPSTLAYIFDDSFPNNVRMLFSMPPYQIKDFKKIVLLFFLLLTFLLSLLSNSHVRADIPQGQYSVCGWTNF